MHAGTADHPRAALRDLALDHQRVAGERALQAGLEVPELDAGAVGGVELLLAISECARVLAVQPDHAGGLGAAAFEPDAHTVAREHRLRGVVGGKDGIETKA